MTEELPPLVTWQTAHERLQSIFPRDFESYAWCTRTMAGKVVFTLLYVAAVENSDRWIAPKHVVRMTDEQAADEDNAARSAYHRACLTKGFKPAGKPWFADNSREPIRDETLRQGFVRVGAVVERTGIPDSSLPRYALTRDFAALFNPALQNEAFEFAVEAWRAAHMSSGTLHRLRLSAELGSKKGDVLVRMPDSSIRTMTPGPSSLITKAVVEQFAPRFLERPQILFISESGRKIVANDVGMMKLLGVTIDPSTLLPDLILADLGENTDGFLLIFIEVVHSDGPIDELRREQLARLAASTKLKDSQVAYVTAYEKRTGRIRSQLGRLALNSFAWFATEPSELLVIASQTGQRPKLRALLDLLYSARR